MTEFLRIKPTVLALAIVAFTMFGMPERAAAINCDQATLQNAINNANSGDTITCNAGSWVWTTPVTVTNKSLRIVGAGIDQTNITGNTPNRSPMQVTLRVSDTFFMSGFTWRLQAAGSSSGIIFVGLNNAAGYPPVAMRLTQMKMYGDPLDGVSSGGRYIVAGGVYGVIDHITMITTTIRGAGNIAMTPDNPISTSNSYHVPIRLGDPNALYIEDCDFQFAFANQGNGAVDHYPGARWVFRRNTVRNNNIGNHGWDSGNRGTRSFEVYSNTFIAGSMVGGIDLFGPRSGTGMVWGNTVKNIQPQTNSTGYINFFGPRYYGALTPYGLNGNINLNARAPGYYPAPPWGVLPYAGTRGPINDGKNNYVTGANPIDGNQFGPGHMDPQYTRTVNDLVTVAGSPIIRSATANFNLKNDQPKLIIGTNISPGRIVTGNWTAGNPIVTSATANFTIGDVGRNIGDPNVNIPTRTVIASVTNSTTAVLSRPANVTGSGTLVLPGAYIVSVTNSSTAVLNVPAAASGTGGTLTIGYSDQGYPLADQPGRGSFPIGNAGNWPNVTTGYTAANYQALEPIYLWGNRWQRVTGDLNVLSDTQPPPTVANLYGSEAYIKRHREFYDDPDTGSGPTLPGICTVGFGFWVTERGGNWNKTNATTNDGALYKCTFPNVWTEYYVPYTYPHPLIGGAPSGPGISRDLADTP